MTTKVITPPAELAVSVEDAKAQLKIDGVDQDAIVEAWVRGITAHAEHLMGRSIINRTLRVTLDSFPDAIRLDYPPVASVESVKYIDSDGVQQTLDPADYVLDNVSEPGYLVPAPGKAWPSTATRINAVTVDYVAGYGADATATPDGIRLYLLAKLQEQFDANAQAKETVQTTFVERLLDPYIIWSL